MTGAGTTLETLRLNRRETERLSLVLALSLAAHLLVWSGYEAGKELGIWQRLPRLAWFHRAPQPPPPDQSREQPLEFVMVEQPSATPPQDAKYYSSQNSRAANPNASDLTIPKLDGRQTDVPKTETVLKPDFNKLQPAPQPVNRQQTPPSPAVEPGDLTLASPKELQQQQPQQTERPRKLSQLQPHQLPGLQMRQDGGVLQVALQPSFDVKLTGFGEYDERFYEAVCQRWWDLLDSQKFARDRTGKVVLRFHLNYDGSVTDMKVAQNDVGELLGYVCQKSVLDGVPFERWPGEMRVKLGDYTDVQFTFVYY